MKTLFSAASVAATLLLASPSPVKAQIPSREDVAAVTTSYFGLGNLSYNFGDPNTVLSAVLPYGSNAAYAVYFETLGSQVTSGQFDIFLDAYYYRYLGYLYSYLNYQNEAYAENLLEFYLDYSDDLASAAIQGLSKAFAYYNSIAAYYRDLIGLEFSIGVSFPTEIPTAEQVGVYYGRYLFIASASIGGLDAAAGLNAGLVYGFDGAYAAYFALLAQDLFFKYQVQSQTLTAYYAYVAAATAAQNYQNPAYALNIIDFYQDYALDQVEQLQGQFAVVTYYQYLSDVYRERGDVQVPLGGFGG